jgi:hypothetical protein
LNESTKMSSFEQSPYPGNSTLQIIYNPAVR